MKDGRSPGWLSPAGYCQEKTKEKKKKKQLPVNLPALPLLPAYLPLHASHSKKKLFFLAVFNQMDELTRESNRPDKSQTFKCFHFTRISEFIGKITNSDWLIFLHFYWSIFRARTHIANDIANDIANETTSAIETFPW